MKMYKQCVVRQQRCDSDLPGWLEKTCWIEERGAKVGATVELLPNRELWTVAKVYERTLPENMLKETQRLNRGSLPSVERMA